MEKVQYLKVSIILFFAISVVGCGGRVAISSQSQAPGIIGALDKMPDTFMINDQFGVSQSARVSLGTVIVQGIDEGATVYASVKGGSLNVNGGSEMTISSVGLGDSIEVFGVAGDGFGQNTSVTLTISGLSASAIIATPDFSSLVTSN